MKKIIFLIAIFTGIIAFGQQEHSGGIAIGTGFKLEDPQPIDDKYVVADSASLHSLPNVYEGLWSYSKADSAIFVYDGVKWERIGGVNGFIELSKSQLDTAIGGGDLVAGALYKITGVNPELYGGTDIYLTAISATELNPNGVGKFYNPKYDKDVAGFGIVKDYVWWADLGNQKESGVYDVDDVVIWGGKHWVCVQETSIGTKYIVDDFELDTDYFEAINYNETDYNIAFDAIKYDYENDWIIERNEKGSNVVRFSYDWLVYFTDEYLSGSVDYDNPIRGFMWGNIYDNNKGVGFQTITNSLNRNINFSGSYQTNLTFDDSRQHNLTFDNNSYQYNLTFDNNSFQYNLTFDNNSYQYNLTFDNNSYQSNLTFDNNSYQYNLTFDNNSRQHNLTFDNSSFQTNLIFDNSSFQYNLTATDGDSQQDLYFKSYTVDRTGLPLTDDEVGITYDNTSQGLKLKGTDVFTITDDEDYIQKKYVDDNYIPTSEKGANNGVATLDGGGKIPATQLPNSVMTLEGEWNASTNTPTLADGIGDAGMIYEVTTAGTQNLGSGSITFAVGDYVVYGSSGVWYKSINSNAVTSVNGQTGVVNLGINSLSDTPANFTGAGGKILAVNSGATAVEYRGILPSDLGLTSGSGPFIFGYNMTTSAWVQYVISGGAAPNTVATRDSNGRLTFADPSSAGHGVTLGYANSTYQPLDSDLTAIAALSTNGFAKRTGSGTWAIDTNTYATTSDLGNLNLQAVTDVDSITTNSIILDKSHLLFKPMSEYEHYDSETHAGFWYGEFEETIDLETYNTFGWNFRKAGGNETNHTFDFDDTQHQAYFFPQAPTEAGNTPIIAYQEWVDKQAGRRIIIPITDDFTLPAMSSPPSQNAFSPITILEDTELPVDHIDWEITWKDSGYTYKLSSLGDFNTQIRESGGDIQIGGQTRSASDIVIDADTMEPVLILKF